MEIQFKNVLQILDYFKDEATCRALLAQQRWGGNPVCPHCNSEKKPYVTKAGYKCSDNKCYKKFTVTVGTIFENSNIKLRVWYAAIYLITAHKKGISSHQLGRDLGVSQKTAWFILHRVREMLQDKAPKLLSGTVEVDTTLIGGLEENKHASKRTFKKYATSGGAGKTSVLGILERNGNVIAKSVRNAKARTLIPAMVNAVELGSTIYTDQGLAFRGLTRNYTHDYTNHKSKQYVRYVGSSCIHTNSIEGFWSQLKRGLNGIYHSVTVKHLQAYCNEYAYRYNTRKSTDNDRFFATLKNSGNFRLTYKALTEKHEQG